MTVETETNLVIHPGNGIATSFPYTFRIPTNDMVWVAIQDSATGAIDQVLTLGVDFTITGVGWDNYAGGAVTYPLVGSPLSGTKNLIIMRTVPYKQQLDLFNQGGFYPESMENQLDLIVFQIQQLKTDLGRVTLGPIGGDPGGGTAEDPTIVHSDSVDYIVKLTQAQYDALGTPDSRTLYVIVN